VARANAAALPTSNLARWLRRQLVGGDDALDMHLAGDAERILDIADALLDAHADSAAAALLATRWPEDARVVHEAGVPHPNRHPMVWLYRAFAEQRAGMAPTATLDAALALPLGYVFPNRPREREVLEWAQRLRPRDASVRHLLGMLAMQRGEVDRAINLWGHVVNDRPTGVPGLYRNLGYAALLAGNTALAADVFAKGTTAEPANAAVWVGNDSLLQLTGKSVAERAAQLDRYPDRAGMPTALVYRYARLLAAAGRFDDAESLFADRFFSRVEGGINPRGEWINVRLARAEAAAAAGHCGEARKIVKALAAPVPRLTFTRDGMNEQLKRAAMVQRAAGIGARCGGNR